GGHSLSHPAWFIEIQRLRTSLRYRAESATARANISKQHERRGPVVPTLPDIRALRGLANRMQPESPRQLLELVEVLPYWCFRFEPRRFRLAHDRSGLNLYQL